VVRRGGTRVARRLSSWVRPEQHHVAAIAEGRFNGLGDPASTTRIAREVIADGIPLDPARSLNPARSQARYLGLGFGQQATQSFDERWEVLACCLPERLLRDAKIFVDQTFRMARISGHGRSGLAGTTSSGTWRAGSPTRRSRS